VHTVLIIDGSASMQAKYDGKLRFDKALSDAKSYISSKTSIVLASELPKVLLDKGSKSDAQGILNSLEPTDMKTNIESALYEADALLGGEKGLVVVISDFLTTDENDQILKAMRILTSKGSKMDFIDTNSNVENVGIIDLDINKYNFKAYVKNYNDKEKVVSIRQVQETKVFAELQKVIKPNSVEVLNFDTLPGTSKIEIAEKDDFLVDNVAYLSSPLRDKVKILLITSLKNEEIARDYLVNALAASKEFSLSISRPPRTLVTLENEEITKLNPDVIITYKINKDELLPHEFQSIAEIVSRGKSIIFTAQDTLGQIDFSGLLPLTVTGSGAETSVCIDIINEFTKRFEEDTCFTEVKKYLAVYPQNNSVVLATTKTDPKQPVFMLMDKEQGKIFYYGIFDDASDFKLTENYPIFWNSLINYLVESEDVNDYNKRLGDEHFINNTKAGYYDKEGKKVALNLLSEEESYVNKKSSFMQEKEGFYIKPEPEKRPLALEIPFMIVLMALILFELIYLKIQGDL
jgi:hypothetical protein